MKKRLVPVSLLLLATTGLVSVVALAPCRAQGAGPAAPVTPAQRSAALAGAQGLIGKMLHMGAGAGDLAGMAQILSNRSAGAVGLMMSAVLGAGIGLGGDLSGGQGKTPSGLSEAQLKSDYAAFLRRWGLSGAGMSLSGPGSVPPSLPPAVAKDGRGFLAGVAALMAEIGPEHGRPSGAGSVPSASDFTYTVLSPTRVRLAMKPGARGGPMSPTEAVLEDGQWRLDMGDLKALTSHMTAPPPHTTLGPSAAPAP